MSETTNDIVNGWKQLKDLVDGLETDVLKNGNKGNNAAGVRVRKGLREVQKVARALVKKSIEDGKRAAETPAAEPTA